MTMDISGQVSKESMFPLSSLPPEIRIEIFSHLVDFGVVLPSCRNANKPFQVWWFDHNGKRLKNYDAILYTNKLFYSEALPALRRVPLLVENCRLITPLANSMDAVSKTYLRRVTLNGAAVEEKRQWQEACDELDKLQLRELEISIDGTDEKLRAAWENIEVTVQEVDDESSSDEDSDMSEDGSPLVNKKAYQWVENMLSIRGLRSLSVKIPRASALEGEIRQYLKMRMVGVQIGA